MHIILPLILNLKSNIGESGMHLPLMCWFDSLQRDSQTPPPHPPDDDDIHRQSLVLISFNLLFWTILHINSMLMFFYFKKINT